VSLICIGNKILCIGNKNGSIILEPCVREQLQHTLEEEEDGDYHDMHFPIPSHPQSTPARFLVCGKVYMASGLPKDTF